MAVSLAVRATFLIGSNFMFLLPAIVAFRDHQYWESLVYFCMGLVSGLYHVVDTIPGAKLLLSYHTWQQLDFYMAFSLISVVTMMVLFNTGCSQQDAAKRAKYAQIKQCLCFIMSLITLGLVIENVNTPLMVLILAGLCIVCTLVAIWFFGALNGMDYGDLVIGWIFIAIGAACFVGCGNCSGYWIAHSVWHMSAAIGIFLMVETRNLAWSCWNVLKNARCSCYDD